MSVLLLTFRAAVPSSTVVADVLVAAVRCKSVAVPRVPLVAWVVRLPGSTTVRFRLRPGVPSSDPRAMEVSGLERDELSDIVELQVTGFCDPSSDSLVQVNDLDVPRDGIGFEEAVDVRPISSKFLPSVRENISDCLGHVVPCLVPLHAVLDGFGRFIAPSDGDLEISKLLDCLVLEDRGEHSGVDVVEIDCLVGEDTCPLSVGQRGGDSFVPEHPFGVLDVKRVFTGEFPRAFKVC